MDYILHNSNLTRNRDSVVIDLRQLSFSKIYREINWSLAAASFTLSKPHLDRSLTVRINNISLFKMSIGNTSHWENSPQSLTETSFPENMWLFEHHKHNSTHQRRIFQNLQKLCARDQATPLKCWICVKPQMWLYDPIPDDFFIFCVCHHVL